MVGQNNHFLITILVGLDSVETGQATLSPNFSTWWDPRDAKTSARRSREFAIKALLAWVSDGLYAYMRQLAKERNGYLCADDCASVMNEDGLWARLNRLATVSRVDVGVERHLCELLVVWRNKVVHSDSRDAVPGDLRRRLLASSQEIAEGYRGMDVESALDRAARGRAPTFKEITALVSAAHDFVENLDRAVIEHMNLDQYLRAVLVAYVAVDPDKRADNIWGRVAARRRASILQVAQNAGMSTESASRTISPEFSSEVLSWSVKDARNALGLINQ